MSINYYLFQVRIALFVDIIRTFFYWKLLQIETYLQYFRNCNESQALHKHHWLIVKVFNSHGNVQRGRPTTYNPALLEYFWTMKLLDYHHEYITNYV